MIVTALAGLLLGTILLRLGMRMALRWRRDILGVPPRGVDPAEWRLRRARQAEAWAEGMERRREQGGGTASSRETAVRRYAEELRLGAEAGGEQARRPVRTFAVTAGWLGLGGALLAALGGGLLLWSLWTIAGVLAA